MTSLCVSRASRELSVDVVNIVLMPSCIVCL